MALQMSKKDVNQIIEKSIVQHLVKSEDLNHHRTLYAGRLAEWFVEAGFIAASNLLPPEKIVCLKVHGLEFLRPVHIGEVACFTGKIVYAGKSSLVTYVHVDVNKEQVVNGFITFIHIDERGNAAPHGLTLCPISEEDFELLEKAKALIKSKQS